MISIPTPVTPTAQPNQSLLDGLKLLGHLCASREACGTRALARQLGWEPTRVSRMLGTLRDAGLASQDGARRYRPGPGIHFLSAQCLRGSGLLPAALPHMRALASPEVGVAVGVLWQGQVCYLLHALPGASLEGGLNGHEPRPAQQSAIGRVLGGEPAPVCQQDPGSDLGSLAYPIPPPAPGQPSPGGVAIIARFDRVDVAALSARLAAAAQAVAIELAGVRR